MEIGVLPWVLCGVVTGVVARIRRHNVYLWSLIGFVAGPLGLILIFAFPPGEDGNSGKVESSQSGSQREFWKRCPYCAKSIIVSAVVCRYCGRHIPDTSPVRKTEETE